MKFSIVVNGAPYSSEAPLSALHFAQAVQRAGHEIYRVFFYHDGVYTGNKLSAPPQDETDIVASWVQFARQHNIEIVVCIAAALRRGMLDESEADRYEKSTFVMADEFVISGLGQMIDASLNADRTVTFQASA